MNPTISDLALDLGQFALDNELKEEGERPPAVFVMRASFPHEHKALSTVLGGYRRRFSAYSAKVRERLDK